MEESVVHWIAGDEKDNGHKCGYCKNPRGFVSYGLWAFKLTPRHYQLMIDRGWRRSGEYCYRPRYRQFCCQLYTIRAIASEFKPTFSMRRDIKRLNDYLIFDKKPPKTKEIRYKPVSFQCELSPENGVWLVNPWISKSTELLERLLSRSESEWFNIANKLQVLLVKSWPPSNFFRETCREEHLVYMAYQCAIHKDPPSKVDMKQFSRFLIETPFEGPNNNSSSPSFGAYHLQFRLNNRLAAVSVIDVLPYGISAVYTFYDPAFGFLNFGTYSALYEIALTRALGNRELFTGFDELKFYYMGYYIHNCQKMKYKGNFRPAFLLCPETMRWQPIEDATVLIEKADNKYVRLDPDKEATDEDGDKAAALALRSGHSSSTKRSASRQMHSVPNATAARTLGTVLSRELRFVS